LAEVTLDNVLQWVSEMKRRKWKWDTRRHALIYLRRAAVMGTRQGLPNQLAGIRLDHQDRVRTAIRVWSLARIVQAIKAAKDPRIAAALVLGGCLGLRPTEIQRVEVDDLVDDVLHLGLRESKNVASVRSLPVPATVLRYLTALTNKRTTGALLLPQGARSGPTLTSSGLHQLLADTLTAPKIAPKDLRKSFATWAATKIPAADLERYLGHSSALHAAVTSRHYLAAHFADQLRPSAALLSGAISGAMV
jgi:integrase